jgi:hypothetical protein
MSKKELKNRTTEGQKTGHTREAVHQAPSQKVLMRRKVIERKMNKAFARGVDLTKKHTP